MRSAKTGGGARTAFFEQRMMSGAREQFDLLRDLRRALAEGQLRLVYQPKIHAPSGEITGAEALMRWEHPQRGLVGPDLFIPIAERFGLIGAMGNWLIEEACRQAGQWRDEGLHMRVAINLSAHQLRHPDLADRIDTALRRHEIRPQLLTCEITESVAMEDASNAIRMVEKLSALGVNISIDDFGTGYSSLSYLRKLRAGELKIDKSFVLDLETSADARAVVDGIVKLAQALGLKVVAEGVETEAQHQILRSFGCHELQGYLFARPMSARALSSWAMEEVGPRAHRLPRFAVPADRRRGSALAAASPRGFVPTIGTMKSQPYTRGAALAAILKQRIVVLDGAMGTMIQRFKLGEADYRGARFKDHAKSLKGNGDLLQITRPDIIEAIHEQYLRGRRRHRRDQHFRRDLGGAGRLRPRRVAREMNVAGARLARGACAKFSSADKPRFVAGALGPTPKTASISPDVNDPAARNVTFAELRDAYREQAEGLLEGGCDLFLVETIFDTLNAKAAIFALDELMEASGERLPVIVSGTVTDASGRILSGQTVGAFWHSVRHARPLAIGLNCALGAALMRPYVEELSRIAGDTFVSCYPNAGLPNPMSETGFDETPEITAGLLEEFAKSGFLNIAGGCCGTTPEHIALIAERVGKYKPRSGLKGELFGELLAA